MHAPLSQKFTLGLLVALACLSWLAALQPTEGHASFSAGFQLPRQLPLTIQVAERVTNPLTVDNAYALQEHLTPVLTVPLRIALLNQSRDAVQKSVTSSEGAATDLPVSQAPQHATSTPDSDAKLYADSPVDTIMTTPHHVSGKAKGQPENLMKVLALYYMLNR